jgi:hypothetical protein
MKAFGNAASFIFAVSLIGFVLFAERAYQESWSGGGIEPTVTNTDTSSAGAPFTGGTETIVMN